MYEDAELASVLRKTRLPLLVREVAREFLERGSPFLETGGEGV